MSNFIWLCKYLVDRKLVDEVAGRINGAWPSLGSLWKRELKKNVVDKTVKDII
jgi:hypothetical protein